MKITIQALQSQIPKELSGRMTKESLERLANHLHLATEDDMDAIPFYLLCDLVITCKELDLKENYHKVITEIQMIMQKIQNKIPQELSGRMTKESLERLANHLHLATIDDMGDIPPWLLYDLAITCKELDLKENYHKVLIEIQMNLEAKQMADLAEQRAELAEQREIERRETKIERSETESKESGAIISANKEFQNINDEKIWR
ncbi:hypothetical protein [Campylobacter jejuni]|uniref:hypothetical protein n=1 Tax=Campylobacter jejuni TaxID=197 RepID=UPI000F8039D6|nr:hypothetical protein [Campylobacter jejuni]RTI84095.1 hypothetical protein C3I10_00015 [Campylobacter jejuni]